MLPVWWLKEDMGESGREKVCQVSRCKRKEREEGTDELQLRQKR